MGVSGPIIGQLHIIKSVNDEFAERLEHWTGQPVQYQAAQRDIQKEIRSRTVKNFKKLRIDLAGAVIALNIVYLTLVLESTPPAKIISLYSRQITPTIVVFFLLMIRIYAQKRTAGDG